MVSAITINLRNDSNTLQNFCFFQQPAGYSSAGRVYVSSLCGQPLLPYATSGAVLSFMITPQTYAGVQQQIAPPQPGQPVGQAGAIRAIELTPAQGPPTANTTTMSVSPALGLSAPMATEDVPAGAFRIRTAVFNPTLVNYNAGVAMQTLAGGILLSNFVTAPPNVALDCTPSLKFYVQIGSYAAGTVLDFASMVATAALCDAAQGFTAFNVSYNLDGTWTVKNMVAGRLRNGRPGLITKSEFVTSAASLPR
ncbi:hypothetical protein DU475_08195 [Rhodopseudomonas sp. WA056]|uniref:hypothetical protein n=1 Tax=Rhodopseudomonas sp. WA056 TaxID=2269367 RepID=UPI0013E01222|nr:hypothetical protein [Rhodopseudomonas sp. WA056]NEW87241.1 hypothetical protein [Rhodopseudomonas sp. WA056]